MMETYSPGSISTETSLSAATGTTPRVYARQMPSIRTMGSPIRLRTLFCLCRLVSVRATARCCELFRVSLGRIEERDAFPFLQPLDDLDHVLVSAARLHDALRRRAGDDVAERLSVFLEDRIDGDVDDALHVLDQDLRLALHAGADARIDAFHVDLDVELRAAVARPPLLLARDAAHLGDLARERRVGDRLRPDLDREPGGDLV